MRTIRDTATIPIGQRREGFQNCVFLFVYFVCFVVNSELVRERVAFLWVFLASATTPNRGFMNSGVCVSCPGFDTEAKEASHGQGQPRRSR